jgi:hypothetical protein
MIVFEKDYSGESIIDLAEDLTWMFEDGNGAKVPVDEYGIHKGKFIVTVKWEEDEEND